MPHYCRIILLSLSVALAADAGAQQPDPIPPGRYVQAANGELRFVFRQLGADSTGEFREFSTVLSYDGANVGASTLQVTVQIGSVSTSDGERDGVLKSPE